WRFHRGFIEEIDTSAAGYLEEDSVLCDHAPIRRVVLSNATSLLAALVSDRQLDHLASLHLIADAEYDEEMQILRQAAQSMGLMVRDMRYPRLGCDVADLLALLRQETHDESASTKLEEFTNWRQAGADERERLRELAHQPRLVQRLTESEHFSHAELLRLND